MPQKKGKPGTFERARRRVASDTAGAKPGLVTNLKRGFAMLGALVTESVAPTKNPESRASIQAKHKAKTKERKAKEAKSSKAAMKKSESTRRSVERATGTSRVINPLRAVEALTKKARKGG